MTTYFEVHERDGPARIGELRLSESVTTPALVDDHATDAGSLWPAERAAPEGDDSTLTILPHRAFPGGTDSEVAEAFAVDYEDVDYPSAAVVSTDTAADYGADAYVFSAAGGAVGHGAAVVDAVRELRAAVPDDTALYFPGVATPRNVATLAYAGVDLFDADLAVTKGMQERYLTTDDEHFLEDLPELPCSCPACRTSVEAFGQADCVEHNRNALEAELARVRSRIRNGRLRDYVEGQARHEQWLTATVRGFDQQWSYLEARTPLYRTSEITAATEDTLRRVEIQRFAERVTERYYNRFDGPLVLVPCSATKPYGDSQSHRQFHDAINFRGHKVSATSPIGVVPQELELTYPAQHYDSVVTGRWTQTEIEFVGEVLERYLRRQSYPRVIAHVPEDYRPVVDRALDGLEDEETPPVEYTVADHPTTDESLANLKEALAGEPRYGKRERQHNTVRAIADYQFGERAGDTFFGDFQIEARYPKLRVHDADGEQLAAMVPQYGTLSLTLAGARRWTENSTRIKRVRIDDFTPHGSVLAPGVVEVEGPIRVGDDVVIEGPSAFGIGRAQMAGPAMVESTRGIACSVRHVDER